MARLREVAANATGATDVKTFIASGNLLLTSGQPATTLRSHLEHVIEEEFGFKCVVVLLTTAQLDKVVEANPFPDADPGSLHAAFAAGPISSQLQSSFELMDAGDEKARVVGRVVYLYLPHGFGGAALRGVTMTKLTPAVTIRGWRTVLKLIDLAHAPTITG